MNPNYTADSICRSMSLPAGFVEEGWLRGERTTIRVLFMPSFHPEVCVTLVQKAEETEIFAVANLEHFWTQKNPDSVLPTASEKVSLRGRHASDLAPLFEAALTESEAKRNWICIDGMPIEACFISAGAVRRFAINVGAKEQVSAFVLKLIDLAWARFTHPHVCNALAVCARYAGNRDIPIQELPPQSPVTRLAILGSKEERTEYLEKLRATRREQLGQI